MEIGGDKGEKGFAFLVGLRFGLGMWEFVFEVW